MRTLAAESAAQVGAAPIHTFALAEGTATIFARAADIAPQLWAETFAEQPKDFAYYALLERTMSEGFLYRYLVLSLSNEEPYALLPLILVDQDLSISLGKFARRVVVAVRRFLPRFLRARTLMAGCLVGEGHFGVRPGFKRRKAAAFLAEALFAYAETKKLSLLAIKDFPAPMSRELQPLLEAGFTRLDGFPQLKMTLDFESFDQYLRERLSKITRKGLRRKFRATAAAAPPITLEVRNDCREAIDEIYPLYLAVAQRSEIEFEVFTREYFLDASRTMPERCRFFIWRQNGKAIAFSYCTVWEKTIFDHDIGLDYAVAHDLHLYYLSFRDIVEWALRHGYTCYRTAPFNYDPKLHLRLQFEPVHLFVRHRSPLLNFFMQKFAPHFAPARSDPVLRRHFRASL